MMNSLRRIFLSIMLYAGIAAFAMAESSEEKIPYVATTGFANQTGDASFDTPGKTASESLVLTLRLLGSWRIMSPDGAPAKPTDKALAVWCGEKSFDYALYGTITAAKDGSQLYSLSVFDRAKAKTTIRKTVKGSSIFDVFSAADTLTLAVVDAITGRHVGFGSVEFSAPGAAGNFRVFIDGIMVGESLAPLAHVAEGRHLVSVRHGTKASKESEIVLREVEVAEGKTTTVTVAISEKKKPVKSANAAGAANGMVLVSGGAFAMGSDSGPLDERPAHEVTIDSFYMSKTEITQKDFFTDMQYLPIDSGHQFSQKKYGDSYPVLLITWLSAIYYCNNRSVREGLTPAYYIEGDRISWDRLANGYRLPTEAEWEYAAKGGANHDSYRYSGSDAASEVATTFKNANGNGHSAVASSRPNSLGLFDMSGNVYEWCWDIYAKYGKTRSFAEKQSGGRRMLVIRGGDSLHGEEEARCAARSSAPSDLYNSINYSLDTSRNIGFRIVRGY